MRIKVEIWNHGHSRPYVLDFTDHARSWEVALTPEGSDKPAVVATPGTLSGSFRLPGTRVDLGTVLAAIVNGEHDLLEGYELAPWEEPIQVDVLHDSCNGPDPEYEIWGSERERANEEEEGSE